MYKLLSDRMGFTQFKTAQEKQKEKSDDVEFEIVSPLEHYNCILTEEHGNKGKL